MSVLTATHDSTSQADQFRLLAEFIPQLVWSTLADGTVEYVNGRYESYAGTTLRELKETGWYHLIHPEDQQQTSERWTQALRTGGLYEIEARLQRSDGVYRWFLHKAQPMLGPDKRIERWFGTSTDIEDQKRAARSVSFLANASELLASSLEPEELLRKLVKLLVPTYVDCCLVDVRGEGVALRASAVEHRDPARAAAMSERLRQPSKEAGASADLIGFLQVKEPVLLRAPQEGGSDGSMHALPQVARELALTSAVIVPLKARGKIIGGLLIGTAATSPQLETTELQMAEELARRAALAVDNALLYQQARRTEQRLLLLFSTSTQGVWVANTEGAVVEEIVPWRAFTGQSLDEAKGEGWTQTLHEEDLPKVIETWTRSLKTGNSYEVEYRTLRPDGTWAWAVASASPARNPDGSIREWVGSTTDITAKKEAEENARRLVLEQSARRRATLRAEVGTVLAGKGETAEVLQACCEAVVAGLAIARAQVWLIESTGASLTLEAAAAKGGQAGVAPSRVQPGESRIGRIAQERTPYVTKEASRDPSLVGHPPLAFDGMVSFMGYPLKVGDELFGVLSVAGTQAFSEDIQEGVAAVAELLAHGLQRRKAEEQLRQHAERLARTNRELEQFAYVSSHDLQEPLRLVTSYVQLLARRYKGKLDADADDFIGYAVEGVTRMQRLIQDLLTYSRVDSRGKALGSVSSKEAFTQALNRLKKLVEEKGAIVNSGALPQVLADGEQLTQLFEQLLGNALKFQRERTPAVEVTAQPEDRMVHFTVKDNGIGIEAEYFDRIFIIFQRLHGRDEYPGTGVGLAICKKIVERHGGRIWVESVVGQGSELHFTLPGVPAKAG